MDTSSVTPACSGTSLRNRVAAKARRGLTLIEAAMVLAILALVVAGIMLFYTNANTSRNTTNALSQLASIQQSVRTLYGGQPSYAGVTAALIAGSKNLPAGMVSGTTLRHSFNSTIDLASADGGGGANSGFRVAFNNIPQEACIRLLSADLGRGVHSAGVGTTLRTQTTGLPHNLSDATTVCSGTYNSVVWIFN